MSRMLFLMFVQSLFLFGAKVGKWEGYYGEKNYLDMSFKIDVFYFQENNKQAQKPVNRFLQDGASASMRSLQTSIETKFCQIPWNGLYLDGLNLIKKL